MISNMIDQLSTFPTLCLGYLSEKQRNRISSAVPPSSPPSVLARNATPSGLEISWQIMRSQKRPVLGYSVNYRSERGEWQQSEADPLTDSLWVTGLACGNNYSVYVTAYNHVGASLPSSVLVSRTLGRGQCHCGYGYELIKGIMPIFQFILQYRTSPTSPTSSWPTGRR